MEKKNTELSIETVKANVEKCCGAIKIYLKTLQRENDYYTREIEEVKETTEDEVW